jgi:hypothetical protein
MRDELNRRRKLKYRTTKDAFRAINGDLALLKDPFVRLMLEAGLSSPLESCGSGATKAGLQPGKPCRVSWNSLGLNRAKATGEAGCLREDFPGGRNSKPIIWIREDAGPF